MLDIHTRLATLKRPRLLTQAARFGVDDYRREIHLPRLLGTEIPPRPAAALVALLGCEAELDTWRKEKAGQYRPALHIEVLIAIMGEARILQATAPGLVAT